MNYAMTYTPGDLDKMKFESKEERQHFINSFAQQVTDIEQKIDQETTGGGLVRAKDAPQPISPRSFYDLVRDYNKMYNKLIELKNLRDLYQTSMEDARNMPKMFDSPEDLSAFQVTRDLILGDSNEKLDRLLEEVQGYAKRLEQIPRELDQASMPRGVWINDEVTGKSYCLDMEPNGKMRLEVEDISVIRRKYDPNSKDLREMRWEKVKSINFLKPLLVRDPDDGQIVGIPTMFLWGAYFGLGWVGSWLIF